MGKLQDLKAILNKQGLIDREIDLELKYNSAVRNESVREIFELGNPPITNLTNVLQIGNGGRLFAVRMDLNKGIDNHNQPVVAGLILRGVLEGKIPKDGIDTLIDGGNYNSAKALKYYAARLNMKGMYVMSRLFPQQIIDTLMSQTLK